MNPILLGLWPIAGITSVGVTREDGLDTIQAAIDAGIETFDTAYSYGYDGESDVMLGEVLRRRENADRTHFVIGKVGQRWTSDRRRVVDGSPKQLIADAEESLKRIGIERFDLLMLHSIDPEVDVEHSASALVQLHRRGLAVKLGICNASRDELIRFADVTTCEVIQCPLNLLQRGSLEPLMRTATLLGAGIHVYWTLMKGLLAGAIPRDHVFAPGDSRPNYEIFQGQQREHAHRVIDRLGTLARRYETTVAKLSIGWALSQDGVSGALVGARRPGQIIETASARSLDMEVLRAVEETLKAELPSRAADVSDPFRP